MPPPMMVIVRVGDMIMRERDVKFEGDEDEMKMEEDEMV